MIVGPGGENIYPEDIETVLNSHVYIADSIVTEQQAVWWPSCTSTATRSKA